MQDAAHPDQRDRFRQARAQHPQHRGRARQQRRAGQPADFIGMPRAFDTLAADGGVGGDHAVHAEVAEHAAGGVDVVLAQVRGDLDQHRHAPAVVAGERFLFVAQHADQAPQRLFFLQLAQAGGVRRGDVDGHVIGQPVDLAQAVQVIVFGGLVGRVLVLADVDAEQAAGATCLADIAHQRIHALVVETEPVDHRFLLRQPEHARLRVAGLWARGDRTHFHEAEAQREQGVNVRTVLVQSGGEANRIRESQPERLGRQRLRWLGDQRIQAAAVGRLQRRQPEAVRTLGIEGKQERAAECVQDVSWRMRGRRPARRRAP